MDFWRFGEIDDSGEDFANFSPMPSATDEGKQSNATVMSREQTVEEVIDSGEDFGGFADFSSTAGNQLAAEVSNTANGEGFGDFAASTQVEDDK